MSVDSSGHYKPQLNTMRMIKHGAPFKRSCLQTGDLISKQYKRVRKWYLSVVQRHRGTITSASWCEGSPCQLRGFTSTANDTERCRVRNSISTATDVLGPFLLFTINNYSSSSLILSYIFYAKYKTAIKQ